MKKRTILLLMASLLALVLGACGLMESIGLVIVSHSKHIAEGVVELISKVAKDVPITYVGGTEGGGIGTSFDQVDRVVSENPADTLLAFFDLGSAIKC